MKILYIPFLILCAVVFNRAFADTPPPMKVGVYGTYNLTPPSLISGQTSGIQLDSSGNLKINSATLAPGASTAANQATANASLANIDADTSTIINNQANGTQKSQLVDGAGAVAGPLIPSAGVNSVPVAIAATNYVVSSANSSTTQLAAGATFTGTAENSFNQPSYSILITTDQPGLLTIFQCIDSSCTNVAQTLTRAVYANRGFSESGAINGNYIKLSFKNNGTSATTTFNLNTAYGTIPSANTLNNMPVSISDFMPTATYRAAGTLAPGTTPTDILTVSGSNTKIVLVQSFGLTCTQNTASYVNISIIKRSSLNTGGTSTTETSVPLSSYNPTATAVVKSYTVNPTALGTSVGTLTSLKSYWDVATGGALTGASGTSSGDFNFGREGFRQPVTLNNSTEMVAINLGGTTHAGNSCNWWVEWLEQ